jgi:hypothetical protein
MGLRIKRDRDDRAVFPPEQVAELGAEELEVLADEDMVRPADADYVDVVLAAAQQHNTVNGASPVGSHRSGLGLLRRFSGDDLARPGTPVRRDATDPLGREG